ncbi:MAG: LPS export ABC transporter periplasmic protein LptC [Proteobacteria bacterium]|nr:LPS export ABC transporter periplasmic protein LptC [Pseudomonadota bacterium]
MHRRIQLFFLFSAITYLLVLTVFALIRSSSRSSVFSANYFSDYNANTTIGEEATNSSSKLQLQDFHRLTVQDGKPVWEIEAKDAKFYPLDNVTHVNNANLNIFRGKNGKVNVKANSARLYMQGATLDKAVLEGNVQIEVENSLSVITEAAEFSAKEKIFSAAGSVLIKGNGYKISGFGLSLPIETEYLVLRHDVECEFSENAEAPKGLNIK